jgi:hypothetical protein
MAEKSAFVCAKACVAGMRELESPSESDRAAVSAVDEAVVERQRTKCARCAK